MAMCKSALVVAAGAEQRHRIMRLEGVTVSQADIGSRLSGVMADPADGWHFSG